MNKFVILGGGYGGMTIATELLEKEIPDDWTVTLVDRSPFQGLKTEYYALAAGTASDTELRVHYPNDPRLNLKYGEVTGIDIETRQVLFAGKDPLDYDYLVIGLGCVDNFHGIPGAVEFANGIQTFSQTRITYQRVNDVVPYGQVTIVGGGLSGVEVAAELRESRPDINIRILDRGASILSSFPTKAKEFVRDWMLAHDIEMRSHVTLRRLDGGDLYNEEEIIRTDTTIWTAGIKPSPLVEQLQVEKDSSGRVVLNEYHQIPAHPNVFVVGDCASLPFSPSAQAAESQGKQIVEVMQALWKNETPRLGQIKLKGVLGSLGKKTGFGLMGKNRVMTGMVPRVLKNGVLWMSKNHFG
ncbi:NAD(P)/FAD-dependent oxidoreductase [Paenibacillus sp. FJAT-26967]|uniref:NAD(P)/FAD-dependent oxidoreductase n=1 Tax=Paenibacillus sp. FJAT-26967 TaxID=1729690 RepID=UPI000838AABD|nr:NAD(P)/FAD-dependent oxidoreductase [Paenibacillus sp. FJAT-26967]